MPDDTFSDDEPVTGAPCRACGGSYRLVYTQDGVERTDECEFCTRGAMSPAQLVAWKARETR